MGVMLSLDRPGPARSRRQGQHVRNSDDQACVDAFAAMLRYDATGAGRYLSRLARTVLAGRLLPAAVALAEAADTALTKNQRVSQAEPTFTVSVPCLLGQCRIAGDGQGCEASTCEHECHHRERLPGGARAAAGASAEMLVPRPRQPDPGRRQPDPGRRHRAGPRTGRMPA
jgi:hypothetical protein